MWMSCWNCGNDIWYETQKKCRHCGVTTRRCFDCSHYIQTNSSCELLKIEINPQEAHHSTALSLAYNCNDWKPTDTSPTPRKPQPAQTGSAPSAQGASAPAAAATAPTVKTTAQINTADLPQGMEVVTIYREAPLKKPRRPIILAHRGDAAVAPENTLKALLAAVKAGAQIIELDVHITRDDVPVVIHDSTVDRCTDGTGQVCEMCLEDIKQLDAGSWFSADFAGERIPTLDEVLQAIKKPTWLMVHLRAHENESDRCERTVCEVIRRNGAVGRSIVSHHTRHGLHRLREMDPRLRLLWIPPEETGVEYVDDAYYMGYRLLQVMADNVDEALLEYAHKRGMWVIVFWADEPEDMQRLIDLGVDGIITNYPARLHEILAAGGAPTA